MGFNLGEHISLLDTVPFTLRNEASSRRVRDKEDAEKALSEAGDGWRAEEKRWRPEIRAPEAQYHTIQTPYPNRSKGKQIDEQRKNDESHSARWHRTLDFRCCGKAVVGSDGPAGGSLYDVEAPGTAGRHTRGEDSKQEEERDQNPMRSPGCRDGIHLDLAERYNIRRLKTLDRVRLF
jgi:hypothetical protein